MSDNIPSPSSDNPESDIQNSKHKNDSDTQIPIQDDTVAQRNDTTRQQGDESGNPIETDNYSQTSEMPLNNEVENENKNVVLLESIRNVATKENADIFIYQASISQDNADEFVEEVRSIKSRQKNVILILTTYGGDPHAAYRIIKCLKRNYEKVVLHVYGYCKSAGTLIALGANEIIMDEFGELGPLDVQLSKKGDFGVTSGLDYFSSLEILTEQAYKIYEEMFIKIVSRSGSAIATHTAAEIASKISTGLLNPILSQLDPLQLGEVGRSLNIANHYGNRLTTNNELIETLVSKYPSHGCVIDSEEAIHLFGKEIVREANKDEIDLEEKLKSISRKPDYDTRTIICLYPTFYYHTLNSVGGKNEETSNEHNTSSDESTTRYA